MSVMNQIVNLFRASLPVVALSSPAPEELTTIQNLLLEVAAKLPEKLPVYVWDLGNGLREPVLNSAGTGIAEFETVAIFPDDPLIQALDFISEYEKPALFILLDMHLFLSGDRAVPEAIRRIKNLAFSLKRSRKRIVLLGSDIQLPDDFVGLVYELICPLPSVLEIREAIDLCVSDMSSRYAEKKSSATTPEESAKYNLNVSLNPEEKDRLIRACLGLSLEEILNALRYDIVSRARVDANTADVITHFKIEKLRRLNIEFMPPADTTPGGCALFKKYTQSRTRLFAASLEAQASKLKLPTPKGLLLVGPSGTGKTLLTKTLGHYWGIPQLKVDIASLYEGVVGATETNLRRLISIAEAIAPCVLVIDEIEKALSGATGNNGDSGTSRRLIGSLLQWMNDKTAPVYVVATANNISELQDQYPELFRKGRFDDIFFVDLPNRSERQEIFANHLERHSVELKPAALAVCAELSADYVGAEICKVVDDAALVAAEQGRDTILLSDLEQAIADNSPQARTRMPQIVQLREWAKSFARPASEPEVEEAKPAKKTQKRSTPDVMI